MSSTLTVLKKLAAIFSKNKIAWALGGHTGLRLQGVKLHDDREIDICTPKKDAYKIQKLLSKHSVDPVSYKTSPTFKAHWGIFKINGIKVEVMGDPKVKLQSGKWLGLVKSHITNIPFEKTTIKGFTLASEYTYYSNTSQKKARNQAIAKAIKQAMSSHRNP